MKYLQGKKDFDLIICEDDIPVPVFNQVLVRVLACGICGTDLHFLKTKKDHKICFARGRAENRGVREFSAGGRLPRREKRDILDSNFQRFDDFHLGRRDPWESGSQWR